MVLIKVKAEDKEKVFEILSANGRFIGLSDNRFNIFENAEEVIKKIEEAGIKIERLN